MSHKKVKKRRRARHRVITALVVILFAIAALAGVYYCFFSKPTVPVTDTKTPSSGQTQTTDEESVSGRKEDFYTVLLCGTDDGNGGTDTIMLMGVDVKNGDINVVSVPRDTLVDVSWNTKKINSTYNNGGIDKLESELEETLGIPVDYYVKVDLKGFVKLVDKIGGVYFDVPINMDYDDPTQDLHIHVNKGYQKLDGDTAIGVVRFRHNNDGTGYGTEDVGRIETQHAFLAAVAEQTLKVSNLSKIGSFAQIFSDYVDSDLSVGNMIWFGKQAVNMGSDNIHFSTLPGDPNGKYMGRYYYILDPAETVTMVNETINPYKADLTVDDTHIIGS
ncbi:Polyisoprenyl-teichoic acid--peptidoglycan teichoic acid transferase TagV [bioreactor metagenome]|uniref:Polyisoprenyl-teichoic acid--peptidoglycan teichoic acid transferase TagV n=1 Tax=bioreactor metagenome TaxID=1076179 RepID=A0A645DZ37_9ZZZZ|nr:LCP family protein [Oscillospiraceae bacterium]